MASIWRKKKKSHRVRRLLNSGYMPLSRLTLLLARTGLVNPFVSAKTILPKRPISVLSRVPARERAACIEIALETGRTKVERDAARLSTSFYSLLGKRLRAPTREEFKLFADPSEAVERQRVSYSVPEGAYWAKVTLKRQADTRRIGVFGDLRLQVCDGAPLGHLDHDLVGRDRDVLLRHLLVAQADNNRANALRILSRLVFLERRTSDLMMHRLLSDIEEVFAGIDEIKTGGEGTPFLYEGPLSSTFTTKMPLSKWLQLEVPVLQIAAKGKSIQIGNIDWVGPCLLAAAKSGIPLYGTSPNVSVPRFHDWIFESDFKAIAPFIRP